MTEGPSSSNAAGSDRRSSAEDRALYRAHYLRADGRRANAVVVMVTTLMLLTIINDHALFGLRPPFFELVAARLAFTAACVVTAVVLMRSTTPRRHDVAVSTFMCLTVAVAAYVISTRPPNYVGYSVATTLGLNLFYFVMPGPLLARAAASALLSATTIWAASRGDTPAIGLNIVIIVHAVSHALGVLVARLVERLRKQGFYAELDERLARRELAHKAHDLALAKERAEQLARAKSDFLATMSHELRTPMNAVLGLSKLLSDARLGPDEAAMAHTIHQSARALLVFFDDILDLAKIDAGRMRTREAPFDLREVVTSAADVVRQEAIDRGVALRIVIAPEVPPGLLGDAGRLRQVLLNLLANAVKLTARGSIELGVHVPDAGAPMVAFTVTDTGPGIAPEALATLFTPFEQDDAALTRPQGGTGLGLSLCKQLATLMGGGIRVESQLGRGSRFEVIVRAPAAPLPQIEPAETTTIDLSALRILVVEDNTLNQMVARAMLAKLGCKLDLAENGREAIEAVSARPYDVILMDLNMPEMDGLEATRRIRALPSAGRALRIFAMSASAFESDRAACTDAGMDGFVSKPVVFDQLRATLQQVARACAGMPEPTNLAEADGVVA